MSNPKVFSTVYRAVVVTVFDAVWFAADGAVRGAVSRAVWRPPSAADGAVWAGVDRDPDHPALEDFLQEDQ